MDNPIGIPLEPLPDDSFVIDLNDPKADPVHTVAVERTVDGELIAVRQSVGPTGLGISLRGSLEELRAHHMDGLRDLARLEIEQHHGFGPELPDLFPPDLSDGHDTGGLQR